MRTGKKDRIIVKDKIKKKRDPKKEGAQRKITLKKKES